MPVRPSGEQFEIAHRDQRATIVEVGGGVREYVAGRRAVLDPYPREAMCDGAHGAPLIPWPNRLADGRYAFDGTEYQLALTEPERGNAIHGLLRWRNWQAIERSADWVTVDCPPNRPPRLMHWNNDSAALRGDVRSAAVVLQGLPCSDAQLRDAFGSGFRTVSYGGLTFYAWDRDVPARLRDLAGRG